MTLFIELKDGEIQSRTEVEGTSTQFGLGLEGVKMAYAHLATQRLKRQRRDNETSVIPMLDARIFGKKVADVESALKQKLGSNRIEVDLQSGNDARIKLVSANGTELHAGRDFTDVLSALNLTFRSAMT